MEIKKVHIDKIRPYWRNPRKDKGAVEAVKESIRKYGYNQPIVVDKDYVIIAGHTRYKALRQLGYKEIIVIVADNLDEDKAKQYRIADNKTAEFSDWDDDLLGFELREIFDIENMKAFFDDEELNDLLDLGDADFDFDEQEKEREIEAEVRAQIMPTVTSDNVDEEEVEKIVEEKVRERIEEAKEQAIQEAIERENERIEKKAEEMHNRFAETSQKRQDDYIKVVCPHCNETLILSKTELIKSQKFQE